MKIRIWGARGSHPHPMTPELFRSKIQSIIQRISPEDLATPEDRERFLQSLPDWLVNIPGGNTPCMEVCLSDGTRLIFDAGTGIIPLGRWLMEEKNFPAHYHMFFSHFHYDHIQGLPFFTPAYVPINEMHYYSPERDLEYTLRDHMQHPYFPVTMDGKMSPHQHFHVLNAHQHRLEGIPVGSGRVLWKKLNHPGNAYAYKVIDQGKSVIIATDVELSDEDFIIDQENRNFFMESDVLILDTMYTLGEAIEKFSWGHSSFSMGVEFAHAWKAKQLLLFHHEPQYDDKRLYANLQNARWYAERQGFKGLQIDLALEGMELEL